MTITCRRKTEVAFSTVYFRSGRQLVVPKGSPVRAFDASLRGRRVCVGAGTTAVDVPAQADLGAIVDLSDNHLDCLVRLQEGRTDAILENYRAGGPNSPWMASYRKWPAANLSDPTATPPPLATRTERRATRSNASRPAARAFRLTQRVVSPRSRPPWTTGR
ncbi:hypothetical protein ACFRCG_02375 [Embleya sp. NPDC056575]|uniref:hypothetical protein n=1 Tax=unclassified Embleya TaxID=2699296 RepID=UPI003690B798